MRRTLFVCFAFLAGTHLAQAQTRVYVSGDLFAEVTKFSRLTVSPSDSGASDTTPPDSVTGGGGVRLGVFFSPEWSLELGVDTGRTISDVRTVMVRNLGGLTPTAAPQNYDSRTSSRFSTTSVLLGFHPPPRGRVHAGLRGGLSFVHRTSTYTLATVSTSTSFSTSPGVVPITTLSVATLDYSSTGNGITATLGAEAAIEASDHFAVVPEVRAHAGGLGAILIRPGVSARWRW
jgi:hypothetical protein